MTIRHGRALAAAAATLVILTADCGPADSNSPGAPAADAVANDNRTPAGGFRNGVWELSLEARPAAWRPDATVDTTVTVLAFAEAGSPASVPGPLLRVRQGTEVRISVRNAIPDSFRIGLPPPRQAQLSRPGGVVEPVLVVHGLRAGTTPDDTLGLPPGAVREIQYRADSAGTFLYWGATSVAGRIDARGARDAQLTGAIVVDPYDVRSDPDERIFVITHLDVFPDSSRPPPHDNIFEIAINGLSWPFTERLQHAVGDTVRWRWVNGSFSEHPMHLHGFHFSTLARGDGSSDHPIAPDRRPLGVTELVEPGGTFRIQWVPTTAGNWIFHCHLIDHVTPDGVPEWSPGHDPELTEHPLRSMAGLVLGIVVGDAEGGPPAEAPDHRVRLLAQQRRVGDAVVRSLVLQEGLEPARDSVQVPGPPLLLTRGETTAITLVNLMDETTTIHWHGMELQSVYDGVAGWSRTGGSIAPFVAPGDSFVVYITPPRAGTFIYHTHMGLTPQIQAGMYGPLLVLEPGETFDPEHDHLFLFAQVATQTGFAPALNGSFAPSPLVLRQGASHRLRIINISADLTSEFSLISGSKRLRWRALASDGADLPPALQTDQPAFVRLSAGETYDFLWTPEAPGEATLQVFIPFPTLPGDLTLRHPLRIR